MAGFVKPVQGATSAPRKPSAPAIPPDAVSANTDTQLWGSRWPAIALQSCIEIVRAAPVEQQADVKAGLPCDTCEKATSCLNAKRKEIGPLAYDQELLTQPRASSSSLFPMELFTPCLRRDESLVPYWFAPSGLESQFKIVQAWDLAWSEKVGGDWLVCMTGVLDLATGQRRLLDVMRWRQISFDQQVQLIASTWKQFGADLVVIESDAAQEIWSKHVGRNTSVPVLPHTAGHKTDLARGVPALLITLSNRKWVIPNEPNSYHHEHVTAFLAECGAFSWVDGKLEGVGEHDDTVMCWWHLSWAMDRLAAIGITEWHRGVQTGRH